MSQEITPIALPLPLVVHAGLPKTATTFLQNGVLAPHPEICTLGKPFEADYQRRHGLKEAFQWLARDSDRQRSRRAAEVRKRVAAAISDPQLLSPRHKCIVLSHEGFLHPQYQPNPEQSLLRLIELFGTGFKIFVTLRSQSDWLESYYFYRFKGGRREASTAFGIKSWIECERQREWNPLSACALSPNLSSWKQHLSPEQMLLLPIESYRHDPAGAFVRVLGSFLNVDGDLLLRNAQGSKPLNERMSEPEFVFARAESLVNAAALGPLRRFLFNQIVKAANRRLLTAPAHPARAWQGFESMINVVEAQKINESNQELADVWARREGWPLAKWGYAESSERGQAPGSGREKRAA